MHFEDIAGNRHGNLSSLWIWIITAILEEVLCRNIYVKSYQIWLGGLREDVFWKNVDDWMEWQTSQLTGFVLACFEVEITRNLFIEIYHIWLIGFAVV